MCYLCPDAPWPEEEPVSDEYEIKLRAYPSEVVTGPVLKVDTTGWTEQEIADFEQAIAAPDLDDEPTAFAYSPGFDFPDAVDVWREGAEVTAYGKPGTVRWVTPWNSVAVVFEDGQMLWFQGADVGEIGERS